MADAPREMVEIAFAGMVIHWRGPSPFFFVAIPDHHVAEVRLASLSVSYGWGVVPVQAAVGAIRFTTALFPKDGGYLLPLKASVRTAATIGLGDRINVVLNI